LVICPGIIAKSSPSCRARRARDSKHDGDALGWAEFFSKPEIVEILKAHGAKA
jgi:hypothetical protein